MRVLLIILFIVLWFGNSPYLQYLHDVSTVSGWMDFAMDRFKVYELMMLTLAIVCFVSCSGLSKALACFAVIMIAGSLIDKIVFGVTGYMLADIVLVMVGVTVSVIVYGRNRSLGRIEKSIR